ncbi:glycosyltransferase [Microbacterium sp. zg.Y909]|uniref:glycosyltransferase n=1 Tax=Microbacterium sp. zg.Y909 TaxID=2969413 RepID=UPI00214ACA0C|nr:glycosyltransferase [Microbacterium sp. zg.Y909]MCR2823949.1 glycosyltransferase [Microbacterium sp. zg.Y909]
MHGQAKLVNEGYRTRDGHLIEWFGKLLQGHGPVAVVSRPEPVGFTPRYDGSRIAENTRPVDSRSWRIPNPVNRRQWWARSARSYPPIKAFGDAPVITWNPFFVQRQLPAPPSNRRTALDLLDDWTIHFAFAKVRREVDMAYRAAFDRVDLVFANSEGTLDLAHRYGRSDATLLLNGTDPERFTTRSHAQGPLTVGYVGKIGKRLDLELVVQVATAFPRWRFVFAGPVLDREYKAPLEALPNVDLLGDVHYDAVPGLLETFDLGWVPHRLGAGEVGGDVIKTYEYRAAGLPVLTTPIGGVADRGLTNVAVIPASEHESWLRAAGAGADRLPRVAENLPDEMTWSHKADTILRALRVPANAA